ncbi:solute carrier family 25 member 40 isoform X2 [Drosophila persimilis]|uniref:solute carrier family 25 member 40 isoform X2 n=1 Tax=Drosophila persimilis TaxID=7234 RepID=UPI000F09262D|nr:solute carrier family 25 member 40 isoform X2 [Drosophila persimilis]
MGKGDTRMGGMEVEEVPVHLPPQIPSQEPRYQIKPMEYVISALIGGLITTIVVTPLEVVKTRVQTQHAMRHKPTISKMCYVFHNGLMTHVCKPNTECVPKPGRDINNMRPLRGAMLATFVTMPFDLITTHTQIELGQDVLYKDLSSGGKTKNADKARPSVFSRLADIYRQQGVRGLYMGVMPRILRVVPACAIMISTFEYSKAFFSHHKLDMK